MADEIKLTFGDEDAFYETEQANLSASTSEALSQLPKEEQAAIARVEQDLGKLTEGQRREVGRLAREIDLSDSLAIAQYGQGAQREAARFSETALSGVKTRELGQIGSLLTDLTSEIEGFDADREMRGGPLSFFRSSADRIRRFRTRYEEVSKSIDRISGLLDAQRTRLLADTKVLSGLYDNNLTHLRTLEMYILAGKQHLQAVRDGELAKLRETAKRTGSQEDALAVQMLEQRCTRFEKKIFDLELTRIICIQMAPQIQMVQATDAALIDKLSSCIANTIPLWKNQATLALGIEHSHQALAMVRGVTDATDRMLREQSERLKLGAIGAAKESERGIVSIETLEEANRNIIDTIDEIRQIQIEGHEHRLDAERRLQVVEQELQEKLLAARNNS